MPAPARRLETVARFPIVGRDRGEAGNATNQSADPEDVGRSRRSAPRILLTRPGLEQLRIAGRMAKWERAARPSLGAIALDLAAIDLFERPPHEMSAVGLWES